VIGEGHQLALADRIFEVGDQCAVGCVVDRRLHRGAQRLATLVGAPIGFAELAGQSLEQRANIRRLRVPLAEGIADDRQCPQVGRIEGWHAAAQDVDPWAGAANLNHNPQLRQPPHIAINHRPGAGGARVSIAKPIQQVVPIEWSITQRREQCAEAQEIEGLRCVRWHPDPPAA